MRSTNRQPPSLWQPKAFFRHCTGPRSARSAALFVGPTPAQSKLDLTYPAVGATAAVPPAGYVVDRTRIKLGEGAGTFAAAKAALGRWEHFRLGWVEAWPPDTPIQAGQVVAVIARLFGLWWLNACRIVYAVDEVTCLPWPGFAQLHALPSERRTASLAPRCIVREGGHFSNSSATLGLPPSAPAPSP
jgi:Domain of unknown function (DUF1990)